MNPGKFFVGTLFKFQYDIFCKFVYQYTFFNSSKQYFKLKFNIKIFFEFNNENFNKKKSPGLFRRKNSI
ncbi:hypothetical protein ETJ58_18625 [Salmonella enterica]|nr:hypothetical protein [Salmonella enterica]EAV0839449.1 hypothetical protein [Salmonella enterica]